MPAFIEFPHVIARCDKCRWYLNTHKECRRRSNFRRRDSDDWCGDFSALNLTPSEREIYLVATPTEVKARNP